MGNSKSVAIIAANLKGNIGDFALLHAALADLRKVFPHHAVDVYPHGFHDIDEKRLAAFRAATDLQFNVVGRTYHAEPKLSLITRLAKLARLWPTVQGRAIRSLAVRMKADAAKFAHYDAVFVVGGSQWNHVKVGVSMFGTLQAVHGHNSQVYAYPFSIDAGVTKFNSKAALRRYFAMIRAPLIARDGISKQVLDRLGVPATLAADCVFSLADEARGIAPKQAHDKERVLLSITKAKQDDLYSALDRVHAKSPAISLMTTCWTEDEKTYAAVVSRLGLPNLAPATWQDAVAELKASSLLITNRLHGIIFASLADTPVLVITNRQKSKAYASDARLPLCINSVAELTPEIIAECLARKSEILDAMRRYRAFAKDTVLSPLALQARGRDRGHLDLEHH